MSVLLVRKKCENEVSLFDYRRAFRIQKLYGRTVVIPKFPKQAVLVNPLELSRKPSSVLIRRRVALDDSESRIAIWRALFKDKPLPVIEEDAVRKYAGSLDKYLPEGVPVGDIINHAKKG